MKYYFVFRRLVKIRKWDDVKFWKGYGDVKFLYIIVDIGEKRLEEKD